MALDVATTALLTAMAASGAKPLHEQTPDAVRAGAAAAVGMSGPGPDLASVADHQVAVEGGSITVRVYAPESPRAAILFLHGGGWVIGTLDESDALARTLAQKADALVLSVDYRLAPEHRYPTALDDAWEALRWAEAHLADRGDGLPLVLLGESAGGNLAAVVVQRAASTNGPAIAAQVLVYPVTDCDFDRESYVDPENQLMLNREAMIWFWDHYADSTVRTSPGASPIRAEDLSGLPPTIVLTAEHDPLRDEGEEYADRLRQAGVAVESQRFAGQAHGFFSMINVLPGAAAGMDYVVKQLTETLEQAQEVRS